MEMNNDKEKIDIKPTAQVFDADKVIEGIRVARKTLETETNEVLIEIDNEFGEFSKRWGVFDEKMKPLIDQTANDLLRLEKYHAKKTDAEISAVEEEEKKDNENLDDLNNE